jgi:preprotein translocase subunit Sec63
MRDLKDMLKGAVDKIKSTVEKEDIPLSEAYAQMDKDIEEAEAAYGKPLFPSDDEQIPLNEYYLKLLGFKEEANFDEIKNHYERLLQKFNPDNFEDKKKAMAEKRIKLINEAFQYFEEKEKNKQKEQEQEQEQEQEE